MLKKNYRIIEKKQDNDMGADVAQQKRSNNKCYASTFRYIQMGALGFIIAYQILVDFWDSLVCFQSASKLAALLLAQKK